MKLKKIYLLLATALYFFAGCQTQPPKSETGVVAPKNWTKEQAQKWSEKNGWLRGCNFIPSTSVNQLENWQAETFDPQTIDRELGWAENIGMNCMRVYLHHLAWQVDKKASKKE